MILINNLENLISYKKQLERNIEILKISKFFNRYEKLALLENYEMINFLLNKKIARQQEEKIANQLNQLNNSLL